MEQDRIKMLLNARDSGPGISPGLRPLLTGMSYRSDRVDPWVSDQTQ